MLEISNDFNLKSYGRFHEELSDPESFKDRMVEVSRLFQGMGESYLQHLGDDSKISGSEKKNLIEYLESILLVLVMLRKIDFSPVDEETYIRKDRGLFEIRLRFTEGSVWELTGSIKPEYKMKQRTFKEWFNSSFSKDIKTFYAIYGNAGLDQLITPDEKVQITKQIDRIIAEIVEMIVFIERFMLFQ
ncbi:hypothetical protein [Leptospira mtsangambouensis]|uniref:hypothetical protein n=1 Tax=Leptospira mtsangambouensis TaxID=2484912 RepID=UPI001EEA97F5|nr:hypothetical protein [Leptospira mtsangambouensis]MCG6139503.1 hypothetical protein [Leptospira mtsangambouensis]